MKIRCKMASTQNRNLADTVTRLTISVMSRIARDEQFCSKGLDVTLYQLQFLRVLMLRGESSMRTLCDELYLSPSSASLIADRLAKQNLIRRREDENDRRIVNLRLSPKGEKLMHAILDSRKRRWQAIMASLGKEDRLALLDAWKRLDSILAKSEKHQAAKSK